MNFIYLVRFGSLCALTIVADSRASAMNAYENWGVTEEKPRGNWGSEKVLIGDRKYGEWKVLSLGMSTLQPCYVDVSLLENA